MKYFSLVICVICTYYSATAQITFGDDSYPMHMDISNDSLQLYDDLVMIKYPIIKKESTSLGVMITFWDGWRIDCVEISEFWITFRNYSNRGMPVTYKILK